MSQPSPKNNGNKPLGFGDLARAALNLSSRYATSSPPAIKTDSEPSMNNPFEITLSKRHLVPSLFQTAARAEDMEAHPALKNHSTRYTRLAERMLNPRKLEAVLNALGKKKKSAAR
jgi:hypothetical protein